MATEGPREEEGEGLAATVVSIFTLAMHEARMVVGGQRIGERCPAECGERWEGRQPMMDHAGNILLRNV